MSELVIQSTAIAHNNLDILIPWKTTKFQLDLPKYQLDLPKFQLDLPPQQWGFQQWLYTL